MGRRWPRVETRDRLSRSGRGKAHDLIGGELIRSWTIVSRGGNGQLQKQGQMHSGRTVSTEWQEAHQQPEKCREGKEKRRKRVSLEKREQKERERDERARRKETV